MMELLKGLNGCTMSAVFADFKIARGDSEEVL